MWSRVFVTTWRNHLFDCCTSRPSLLKFLFNLLSEKYNSRRDDLAKLSQKLDSTHLHSLDHSYIWDRQELFQFLAVQLKFWTKEAKMTKKLSKYILKCLNKFKIFLNWVLKFLGRDISRKGDMKKWKNDISRSSNYSSKIYQKWDCLIYLARVITQARYIKQSHFRYIDFSFFHISLSQNISTKKFQKSIHKIFKSI